MLMTNRKNVQHMHGIIPFVLEYLANPVVHLLHDLNELHDQAQVRRYGNNQKGKRLAKNVWTMLQIVSNGKAYPIHLGRGDLEQI